MGRLGKLSEDKNRNKRLNKKARKSVKGKKNWMGKTKLGRRG